LSGRAQRLPTPEQTPPIETIIDAKALEALRDGHPGALGAPRQQARFLAGITSPATSRAKLTRDPLFGSLADRRFGDLLAWCQSTVARGPTARP
jgi:ATP-dependent DNA helicase RecQ